MQHTARTRHGWGIAVTALLCVLAGCAGPARDTALRNTVTAYERGRYAQAYRMAVQASGPGGRGGAQAAYLAGLAAQKLNRPDAAQRHLSRAARSDDPTLAADARASLGLLHHARGRYRAAASALEQAGRQLTGEQRANAFFYAAIAHQKQDQWAQARTDLILARAATRDANLRRRIEQRLAVTGYTIQVGAFTKRANAQRAAQRLAAEARRAGLGAPRLNRARNDAGRRITLVQVGRFTSFRAAHAARRRLSVDQAIVVPIASK